jgi:glycosyltransferase involved in cell wall biosynthesis
MKKKVLFLYGNRPEPLPVHMMHLLDGMDVYQTELLYFNRKNSPISLPLSGLLDQEQCSRVTWSVGDRPITKLVNRCIVLGLFIRKIRAKAPDVIHAWNFDMLVAARIAAITMKDTKVVHTLQDTRVWMLSPIVKALQRWAYRGTDQIFVTSQGFETHFLRRFGLIDDEQEVVFVPNVPPAHQFADFEPRSNGMRLTVGYIGLFRGREGIDMLYQAARLARKRGAEVHLLFAGKGRERGLVESLAEENGFIDYLGPYRHDQDIQDIYRNVDALYAIYDRSYDKKIHLAYRLCEAVNCRLPIIVAEGTHMSDVVETYDIGVSIDLGDIKELAQALVRLSQSNTHRKRIAGNCEKVRPQFVFEFYQKRIKEAYEGLWIAPQPVHSRDNDRQVAHSWKRLLD